MLIFFTPLICYSLICYSLYNTSKVGVAASDC